MQSYLVLGTWTQKGYETIDAGPAMLEEYVDRIESMGGSFDANDFYLLTGDHDWAALVQLPSHEAAARLAHGYAKNGRGRMHFQSVIAQGPGGYEEYAGSLD
jgi:uncharacterized protein with GYD domain